MRTKLGRVAAPIAMGASALALAAATFDVAAAIGPATSPAPSSPAPSSVAVGEALPVPVDAPAPAATTSTTSSTTTSTVAGTTTTSGPPLVIDVPAGATPSRGTQKQIGPTLPPPPKPDDWLPDNSGEGRRIVYSKTAQRVWLVEADNTVVKTHRVSGRLTWNQPLPGTYAVFSKSSYTCAIKNPNTCWRYMVRFTKGPEGDNIGFHEIPRNNGVPLQSEAQLGQALSHGCVRQATADALFLWNWTPVGTKVVVLA